MAKMVLSMNGAVQGEFPRQKARIPPGMKPDNESTIDK